MSWVFLPFLTSLFVVCFDTWGPKDHNHPVKRLLQLLWMFQGCYIYTQLFLETGFTCNQKLWLTYFSMFWEHLKFPLWSQCCLIFQQNTGTISAVSLKLSHTSLSTWLHLVFKQNFRLALHKAHSSYTHWPENTDYSWISALLRVKIIEFIDLENLHTQLKMK